MSIYIPLQQAVRVTAQEFDKAAPYGDPSIFGPVCPNPEAFVMSVLKVTTTH